MEIIGSAQYVDLKTQKESWYQLYVINQWDFKTKAICFQRLGTTIISYCLKLNTPKTKDSYKSEIVEIITDEMKDELISKGMTLSNRI